MAKPTKPNRTRADDCLCDCDFCPDDCENCDHVGCDAKAENCEDCPMDGERALKSTTLSTTAQLPAFQRAASIEPASINEELRAVDVVWTSGAPVLRGVFDQYFEELEVSPTAVRMGRLQSGCAPLLNAHQSGSLSDVIGVVEHARLDGARGIATVRFAKGLAGDEIFGKVKDGILRNISVGYRVYKLEKVQDGIDQAPTYRARDWEPFELSLVPVGADAAAVVRAEAAAPNLCTFITRKETQMDPTATGAEAKKKTEVKTAPIAADDVRAAARTEERERIQALTRTAAMHKIDPPVLKQHVDAGTAADEFRRFAEVEFEKRTAIDVSRAPAPGASTDVGVSGVVSGESQREKFERGAGAWLLQRSGTADLVRGHAKKNDAKVDTDPGECRGMTMLDLARHYVEMNGVSTRGMAPADVVGRAFTMPSTSTRAGVGVGAASTSDFPVLLQNVLHKVLLAAYGTVPDTWSRFCMTGSVMDFRPHYRFRMGTFGGLSTVNEGGEFPNKPITDGISTPISAQTKGNIIAITRQAIINDDMDAFSRLATMLGRAARLSIELDVYALLAMNGGNGPTMSDGFALFSTQHGNLTVGSAIGSVNLDLDRIALAMQRDISGNEILDLRPAILLLGIGQGALARQIIQSQYDYDVTGKFQIANRVLGVVGEIIDSPRIATTRRYMFANPSDAPVIEVAFLQGQQQPYMESQQGWRIDATEWKVRFDYGVGAIDWKGAVSNVGA